jgi:hypothetical protein
MERKRLRYRRRGWFVDEMLGICVHREKSILEWSRADPFNRYFLTFREEKRLMCCLHSCLVFLLFNLQTTRL